MNRFELNIPRNDQHASCSDLATLAEKELAAFFKAVKELFGAEQAKLSAEDWLRELGASQGLPTSSSEWRRITVKVATRLASRLNLESMGAIA